MTPKIIKGLLQKALDDNSGLLIGKIGTIECHILYMLPYINIPIDYRNILEKNAGVFPNDIESVLSWANEAKQFIHSADCLSVGWYDETENEEEILFKRFDWKGQRVQLRSLEPYYAKEEERWTTLLAGQDVCAVTSFTQSAQQQITLGENKIWPEANGSIWPSSTRWHWVQTGYAPVLSKGRANWENSPESWSEAVIWVIEEVLKTKARIVIIGCGGLGMIIGQKLKQHGIICMVLGGATQVLFGIKGKRWEKHPVISKFWNSNWIWPSPEETPAGACDIEQGCYWK